MNNLLVLLLPLLAISPPAAAQLSESDRIEIPGQLVVCFETGTDQVDLDAIASEWNLEGVGQGVRVEEIRTLAQWVRRGETLFTNIVLVEYSPESFDLAALRQQVLGDPSVEWAAPNVGLTGEFRELEPNDPLYGSQYHHPLMQSNLAWDITLGDASVIIGVTDDGVDLDHEDLQPNIWVNTGETPGDGVDNDSNGFIDDVNGFDFVADNNDPNPEGGNDHGTHVSGIAAAKTDNNIGIAGVAGDSTIMPLQFYSPGQPWTAVDIMEAFSYGADNGARIITTSYNMDGWVGDALVHAAFDYIYDAGVLHFNSAGNGAAANPPRQVFHQSFLVASTESNDGLSSFSNYGTGIDLAAPGGSVFATVLNDGYDTKSGTSMAAPNAAGVAALIWAANPTWTRDQVAAQIYSTADSIDAQNPSYEGLLGGGRVNPFSALTQTLPAPRFVSADGLPPDGGALVGDLSSFKLRFDQVMDPSTVNAVGAFSLFYAGPDGIFGTGDDIGLLLDQEEYLISSNEVSLSLAAALPFSGEYRVTAVSSVLTNPFGTNLDGDGDGAPGGNWFTSFSACATTVHLEDNAESGTDWSVVNDAGLLTGAWTVPPEVPIGGGLRSDPADDFDGSGRCFLTENAPGNTDVDGGYSRLISRKFDLSGLTDPYLSFALWHVTSGGDPLEVDVSNDDGATWIDVETFTGGPEEWEIITFRVGDHVAPSSTTRLRFSVADLGGASITESGIDYLRILTVDCGGGASIGTNYCIGAVNSTGQGAVMSATGSTVVADNDLTLRVDSATPTQNGVFYFGPQQVQIPFGGGFRCVGGSAVRLPVTTTDSSGGVQIGIDLTAPPALGVIAAGADLNFQYWYRDPTSAASPFNLSDGLNILFQ